MASVLDGSLFRERDRLTNGKLQCKVVNTTIEAWVQHGRSEGVLQVGGALDMVMCLWDTYKEVTPGQMDIQVCKEILEGGTCCPVKDGRLNTISQLHSTL